MKKIELEVSQIKQEAERISKKLSIGWQISLIVILEITVAIVLATGLSYFLTAQFKALASLPLVLWIVIFGVAIGSTISIFVNRALLSPIRRLEHAMRQVTDGNFAVQLEPASRYGDIENIYKSFNLMTEELAATEILKTDFVSNVSHEIKTPISAIEGYASLLQGDDTLNEEQREYAEKILANSNRLSELVGNVLLLSKIDNQAINTHSEVFALDEQIRHSILLLEPKWAPKEIEFEVELDSIRCEGNKSLMVHIWNNLIGNAVKFTPDQSKVTVRLYQAEQEICFSVEDEGCGLDEETQKHMFDKFYQGDTSHKQEGNGLGLALVKRITLLYGGRIAADNLPIGGCRFSVFFPITPRS
ncbi:MAG: HAMP domain-containing histidine kinase [Clostridia bacterium]|nr:HAMP domain-containing histidine kinase [Clostridia bacterium]